MTITNNILRAKSSEAVLEQNQTRINWLAKKCNVELVAINKNVLGEVDLKRNIENFIGATQVPLGIAGPVKVNGDFAKGLYYVPFATTEGTLVDGYTLGMIAMSRSGGANVKVLSHRVDITPVFELLNICEADKFANWLVLNYQTIKADCEAVTKHSKLIEVKPLLIGRRVYVYFGFNTADAMGLNTISIATNHACQNILKNYKEIKKFYLRSNLSADKKAAYSNFLNIYGREVIAECVIKKEIVRKYLTTTPEAMTDFWHTSVLSGFQAGTVGHNAHYANALAAIYVACGQDVAQILNSSSGISTCELLDTGDVYLCLRLPCLIIGTVGGGTNLPTQKECLQIMDCHGNGGANRFAEIIAATLLAGEISICAALSNGEFIKAHIKKKGASKNKQ